MIHSILDNDFYKFSMQQAYMALYPRMFGRYEFFDRNRIFWPAGFASTIRKRIDAMEGLKLTSDELEYITFDNPYFTPAYLDFLKNYRFCPSEVTVSETAGKEGGLRIVAEGPLYRTALWEVPILATVSQSYYQETGRLGIPMAERTKRNKDKGKRLVEAGVHYSDFGTRRRFSYENHDLLVRDMREFFGRGFIGTSNVHLAMKHGVKYVGTVAHEWTMLHAALYGYKMANKMALQRWADFYRGALGVALTDTYGTDDFFMAFDGYYARLYDGIRQDSACPFEFGERAIMHYNRLKIDPKSKTVFFSDGLNVDKIIKLEKRFGGVFRMIVGGIGTDFSNDVGETPLNIVMKLTGVRDEYDTEWTPTVKLSDVGGKYTGEASEIDLCLRTLGIQ